LARFIDSSRHFIHYSQNIIIWDSCLLNQKLNLMRLIYICHLWCKMESFLCIIHSSCTKWWNIFVYLKMVKKIN
jgi:hypothetical protein